MHRVSLKKICFLTVFKEAFGDFRNSSVPQGGGEGRGGLTDVWQWPEYAMKKPQCADLEQRQKGGP